MPIENRELASGTRLVARYKKADRSCEVIETADGLRYRLDDGTEHKSPSSAGKAAMGGVACNGWRFWSVAGTETTKPTKKAAKPKGATAGPKKPAKKAPAKKKSAKKAKAQRAAAKGDSYGCGVCAETFPTMKAATAHALTHTSS
jgi:hypothetical protein